MKKIISILLLTVLIFSSFGVIATPKNNISNENVITEKIEITKPVLTDEGKYLSINLEDGNSYLLEQKNPMIPTITRVYTLPFKTKINSVNINYNGKNELSLSKQIKPVSTPTPIGAKSILQKLLLKQKKPA